MVKLKLAATAAQVKSVCDLLHQYEPMEKRQLQRIQKDGFYRGFARSILDGDKPQLGGYVFDLVHFRSIDGSDLPSILPVSCKIVIKRKLKAFVGHRFNDAVTPNLRHNLAILFKAYGIQPWYSDSDSPNGPVFSIILDRIRKSDFSVFDDRETETRPNTLIEIGTAIASEGHTSISTTQTNARCRSGASGRRSPLPATFLECSTCPTTNTTFSCASLLSGYRSLCATSDLQNTAAFRHSQNRQLLKWPEKRFGGTNLPQGPVSSSAASVVSLNTLLSTALDEATTGRTAAFLRFACCSLAFLASSSTVRFSSILIDSCLSRSDGASFSACPPERVLIDILSLLPPSQI
jgi:hypothetical protein